MKFLLFLLLLIFPVLTASLNCEYGGSCYIENFRNVTDNFSQKTCDDACVYFKCQVGNYKIMEGGGCHEDFVNACKHTPAEIKNNIKDYFYVDSSNVYVSCKDGNNCATNAYKNLIEKYPEIESNFRYRPFMLNSNEPNSCEYDNSPKPILPILNCYERQECHAGKHFLFEPILANSGPYNQKQCDACLFYHCTSDGKTIKTGWGCYVDFYAACKDVVNSDVEVKLKKDIKEAFYYDRNLAVFTCSNRDYCQFFDIPEMINVNSYVVTKFLENVQINVDGNCDDIITPIIPITTTQLPPFETTTSIPPLTTKETPTSASPSPSTSALTTAEASSILTSSFSASTHVSSPSTTAFPVQTTFTGACEYGEVCYDYRLRTPNFTTATKKCNDFCVYYKCLIIGELDGLFNVKEGYGCFNDFVNACTFTGYQTKDKIRMKGPNYQSHDEKLIYVSCNNKDGCAKETMVKMIAVNASIKEHLGYQGIPSYGSRECPRSFLRDLNFALRCNAKSWCKSGTEFSNTNEHLWTRPKYLPSKFGGVEACVSYMCTIDGKTIIGGSGTYNDFKRDCYSTLTFGQRALLNGKEKNIFYADKNVIFMSSDDGYGILEVKPFETYLKLNAELVKPFYDNIDENYNGTCAKDYKSTTVKPQPQDENAIFSCDSGEVCYDYRFRGDFFNTTAKQCNGKCVYYKCIELGYSFFNKSSTSLDNIRFYVKEGYGCFDDFANNCKFTGYQTKDKMKNGGSNYQYHDSALIYLSCNNTNECAREAVVQMKTNNSAIEKGFGWEKKSFGSNTCFWPDFERYRHDSDGFKTTAWCKSGRQFKSNEEVKERSSKTKNCDPSISFMCTSDGRLIKGGIGCIEDIKIACENIISNDLIKKLEGNPGKLFYADENVIVSASTSRDSERYFDIFLKINPELIKPFYDNIDGDSDELCKYQKPHKEVNKSVDSSTSIYKPQALVAANHGTRTSIKLHEIFLFGFIVICFL